MKTRSPRGPVPKPGATGVKKIAWKSHPNSTKKSRMFLCVLYYYLIEYYEIPFEPVHHRPDIKWNHVVDFMESFLQRYPGKILFRDDTELWTLRQLVKPNRVLSGRWSNFFNQVGKGNGWYEDEGEHPKNNSELQPLLAEAHLWVRENLHGR